MHGLFSRRSKFSSARLLSTLWILAAFSFLWAGCATVSPRTFSDAPTLALSATSFNFSTVVIGKSATKTLHLTNTGSAPLTIDALSLNSQQFTFTGPSVPRTVLPTQVVDYTISFDPSSAGNFSASLLISSDASSAPAAVSLSGVAEKPFAALQVTPAPINFGSLKLLTTGTQNITLKNMGDINLTISGVSLTGSGFSYSNLSPGLSLAPNQTATFQVSFRPQVVGSATGTLSILSANLASPEETPVSGQGVTSTSTAHSVTLSWLTSPSLVTGYRVYRGTISGADFWPLTSIISNLSYTDKTVLSGVTYYYVVTAVDAAGIESPFSNQVTVTIPSS